MKLLLLKCYLITKHSTLENKQNYYIVRKLTEIKTMKIVLSFGGSTQKAAKVSVLESLRIAK